MNDKRVIEVHAVGDMYFGDGSSFPSSVSPFWENLKRHFDDDALLIGNLESPLTLTGDPQKGKCTLHSDPLWADYLNRSGFNVISLANNHIMDFGAEGLRCTIDLLTKHGIHFLGAGENIEDACRPIFLQRKGQRIALLARSSVIVSSPSYASQTKPGVAFLDVDETKATIEKCREQADIVILLIHWGIEHYFFPSPEQRKLAQAFIGGGVDLILGHHPHVLQGIERIHDGLVCYSLGNFTFREVLWSFIDQDGQQRAHQVSLSQANRQGGLLSVSILGRDIREYHFLPTYINADGSVSPDKTDERMLHFKRLCARLSRPLYQYFWWLYSTQREWTLRVKPLLKGRLSWHKLKKFRFRHMVQLFKTLQRSLKITAEKSTSPYD